ncbi:MAG: phage terminase small subunit P27 family [Nitrospirales bacterium]
MQEPQFESGIPAKPTWFDLYASEEWDRLVGNLNGQRVFTKNDLGILVSICVAYEQFRECLAIIKQLGRSYTVEDMGGNKHYKARPECVRFETAQKEYRTLLAEIGFSPSSRSKVKTLPEPPKPKGTAKFFT